MMKSSLGVRWPGWFFLAPILMFQNVLAQGILPPDRVIDWTQAGVPGLEAIRASRTVFTNVAGLDTSGKLDCSAAIQAAVNACPSNGIVVLPAGRLAISAGIALSANSLSRGGFMTLSGATNGTTTLIIKGHGILTGNENFGQSNNIVVSSLIQGTSNFFVSSPSAVDFGVGDVLQLSRQDEAATNFVLVFNNNGLTNSDIAKLPVGDLNPPIKYSSIQYGSIPIAVSNDASQNAYIVICTNGMPSPTVNVSTNTGNVVVTISTNGVPYQSQTVIPNGALQGFGNWYRIGSADVLKQYVLCTGVSNGTNVSFWPPLYWSWTNPPGLYAYCKKVWGASAFVGVENLTITNAAMIPNLINFAGTYGSWLKNCKIVGYGSPIVMCQFSLNCEVRDCDFVQPSATPPGGDVTGLEFNTSSAFKAEDNTFSGYWSQILLESSASGGVISYNYFTNEYLAAGASVGYLEDDVYLNHEAHDMMNLLEGNIMSAIQADNYHGGSSHNTFFRNWFSGLDTAFGHPMVNNIKCIDLCRYSYYYNIVGNVIGNPALTSAYYEAPTNGTFSSTTPAIYRLGFPDLGDDCVPCGSVFINWQGAPGTGIYGYPIAYDPAVAGTIIRLCNYDYVTQGIPDGTVTLPNSLIYPNGPPTWWGNRPWPAFDPNTPSATSVTNLAAGARYYQSGSKVVLVPPTLRLGTQ